MKIYEEILGSILFGIFLLGWFNLGQGPEWTWWKLIAVLGDVNWWSAITSVANADYIGR